MADWGLDLVQCFNLESGAQAFRSPSLGTGNRKRIQSVHELMLAKNIYQELAETSDLWLWSVEKYLSPAVSVHLAQIVAMVTFANSPWAMKLFLPYLRPGHYAMAADERFKFFRVFDFWTADSIRYLLWENGQVLADDIRALDGAGVHLIELVAIKCMMDECILSGGHIIKGRGWRQLARDIMGLTALLHFYTECADERGCKSAPYTLLHCTALQAIPLAGEFGYHVWTAEYGARCYGCPYPGPSRRRRVSELALHHWLEDLQASGVDLNEYGRVEQNIFMQNDWRSERPAVQLRLSAFSYGPEPRDWKFTWEIDYGEIVAEFWEQVENPRLNMVGAWVDDTPSVPRVGYWNTGDSSVKTHLNICSLT